MDQDGEDGALHLAMIEAHERFDALALEISLIALLRVTWYLRLESISSYESFLSEYRESLRSDLRIALEHEHPLSVASRNLVNQCFDTADEKTRLQKFYDLAQIDKQVDRYVDRHDIASKWTRDEFLALRNRAVGDEDLFAELDNEILKGSPRDSDPFHSAYRRWRPRVVNLAPSLITSVRDITEEYMQWLRRHPNALTSIAWEAFERIIAEILRSCGYQVDIVARDRGGSADLLAIRTDYLGIDTRYLVECKRYGDSRKVGLSIVNEVLGAAKRANVDHALLVTTSSFTREVESRAAALKEFRLHLRDGNAVKEWLKLYSPREGGGLWFRDKKQILRM